MKATLLLVALCCLVQRGLSITEEEMNNLLKDKDACIGETGVDPAAIEEAKKGRLDQSDVKLACFAGCILQKLGVMDADLTVHADVAKNLIPPSVDRDAAEKMIDKCKDMPGIHACVKGGLMLKCLFEHKELFVQ